MLCYAILDLYPTRWSLLMEDLALVMSGATAILLLSVLAAGLIMTALSMILLPTYLFGVLRPTIQRLSIQRLTIQKIARCLQKEVLKENIVPTTGALLFPDRDWTLLIAPGSEVEVNPVQRVLALKDVAT